MTIIGNGKMARALIAGLVDFCDIEVVGRDEEKLRVLKSIFPKISTKSITSLNIDNKNILLCVKPYALESVAKELLGKANILISILAGVKIDRLKSNIKSDSYLRFMPNLGATYLKSATSVTGDIDKKEFGMQIAKSIGKAIWVDSETELDIATALAGSGPAYLSIVAEALIDGAVKEGLSRDKATLLTSALFDGFSELLKSEHPAMIKDATMSPAGTTARGCYELEQSAVRGAFMRAISEAFARTKEI